MSTVIPVKINNRDGYLAVQSSGDENSDCLVTITELRDRDKRDCELHGSDLLSFTINAAGVEELIEAL